MSELPSYRTYADLERAIHEQTAALRAERTARLTNLERALRDILLQAENGEYDAGQGRLSRPRVLRWRRVRVTAARALGLPIHPDAATG